MFILDQKPQEGLRDYLWLLHQRGQIDVPLVEQAIQQTLQYLSASKDDRAKLRAKQTLENYWYEQLSRGKIAYDVYDTDLYLADLWCCWIIYSREYLRGLNKSIYPSSEMTAIAYHQDVNTVIDLGCGIGYTTAALCQLFPKAQVYGTNLPNIKQTLIAEAIGQQYGFKVVSSVQAIVPKAPTLIFASEYFEHVIAPVGHLVEILTKLDPEVLWIANAFTALSIGHFPQYLVNDAYTAGRATSKLFNTHLEKWGYQKIKIGLWNNRPAYWVRK